MSELRIIPVVFGGKHFIITDHRMQYDYGQVLDFKDLELPDSFEARFSNSPVGESVGQIGTNNRIRIPKQFFESGEPIYCYITLHDEVTDGRTVYTTKVPIKPSTERTEEEPEPEEESIITQAITALNNAVDVTSQKAQEASESADRAEQAADGIEAYVERAEAAQSASESARDRATQAETSARTSAATASEKASEAISSAATASQSALTAENASESAQASATASAESASQAGQSADTASDKASDASEYASNASTSAQTASQKALEASQSASTATQAKTDAETAKTASQTAQGLAETARDGAVTAKTSAEDARNEAQDIVDGITNKIEQIDSNTDRIESLEDDRYKPYPTDTASGAVASFPDGADNIPLKSCIVQVEPVQDLHGYDYPWPAGGGKNLINYLTCSGIGARDGTNSKYSSDTTFVSGDQLTLGQSYEDNGGILKGVETFPLLQGEYVTISFDVVSNSSDGKFAIGVGDFNGGGTSNIKSVSPVNNRVIKSVAAGSDYEKTGIFVQPIHNTAVIKNLQVEHGQVASPTYAPYSNICPISGWTGANVQRTGVNVWDEQWVNGYYTTAGTLVSNSKYIAFKNKIHILPGRYYCLTSLSAQMGRICFYDENENFVETRISYVSTTTTMYVFKVPQNVHYMTFDMRSTYGATYNHDISINDPSTDHDYHESHAKSYTIDWQSEAGTVYGGTLDVTAGELVVDVANIASYNGESLPSTWISDRDVYAQGATPTTGAQVVYKLAEPITYQLTPTELNSLLGTNNIWADTGDTEVEYRADTKLYIQKKIAEAISALS